MNNPKEPQNRINMLKVFTSNYPKTFTLLGIKTKLNLKSVVNHHATALESRELIKVVGKIPGENNIPTRIFRATKKAMVIEKPEEYVMVDCAALLFQAWPNAVCN